MVQVTFDTSKDTLEELEQALGMLQQAIDRRKGTRSAPETGAKSHAPKMDMPTVTEETAVDTPFFKITVKSDEPPAEPSLNQLLDEDGLSEDELSRMFKEQGGKIEEEKKEAAKKDKGDDPYIEIIEYTDDKA